LYIQNITINNTTKSIEGLKKETFAIDLIPVNSVHPQKSPHVTDMSRRPDAPKRILRDILPAIYLVLVLVADHFSFTTTITPICCVLGLSVMAFHYSPKAMIFWGIVFWVVVAGILGIPRIFFIFDFRNQHFDLPTNLLRGSGFGITAFICFYISLSLNRLEKKHTELLEILSLVPEPILTSDINGKIRYANRTTIAILGLPMNLEKCASYFDLLAPRAKKGATIARYLKNIESPKSGHEVIELEINGTPVKAMTRRLKTNHEAFLMTMLFKSPDWDSTSRYEDSRKREGSAQEIGDRADGVSLGNHPKAGS